MPTDCWLRSTGGRSGLGRVLRYKRVAAARANREMMAGVGRGENSNWRRNSMMLGHTDTHGVSEVLRLGGFRCSKGQAAFRRYSFRYSPESASASRSKSTGLVQHLLLQVRFSETVAMSEA